MVSHHMLVAIFRRIVLALRHKANGLSRDLSVQVMSLPIKVHSARYGMLQLWRQLGMASLNAGSAVYGQRTCCRQLTEKRGTSVVTPPIFFTSSYSCCLLALACCGGVPLGA